jgi:hypothetical protein
MVRADGLTRSTIAMQFLLRLFACTLLLPLPAVTVHAQSIILQPAVVPLSGKHGEGVSHTLTLRNDSGQAMDFALQAQDVVVRDGARVFVDAGRIENSVAATAVFNPPTVHVPPHSTASVQAMFTLPAATQQRAVVAMFRGTTRVKTGGRDATLSLGTLFTFTLSDRISVAAGPLRADPPSANTNALLRARLDNNGAEPVVPAGVAVLVDARGGQAGKAAFTPRRLLPGEAADFSAEYPGDLPPGLYNAIATFDIGGRAVTLTAPLRVE